MKHGESPVLWSKAPPTLLKVLEKINVVSTSNGPTDPESVRPAENATFSLPGTKTAHLIRAGVSHDFITLTFYPSALKRLYMHTHMCVYLRAI